jgi:hypothetical protein
MAIETGKNPQAGSKGASEMPMSMPDRAADDPHYNLISILYHALKGADLYDEYISDAEAAGDAELRSFFEQVQQEENRRAQRARVLLTARLASGTSEQNE